MHMFFPSRFLYFHADQARFGSGSRESALSRTSRRAATRKLTAEIDSQASSNEGLNETWAVQMCGISKWKVAMTDGRLSISLLKSAGRWRTPATNGW